MFFKRLGYFVQVAELGSLSRTAERLRISQPSLSRQMRLLEEQLGVALFTRLARGMRLTTAGELLYARVTGPMREIGRAIHEVKSLPKEERGQVVLGLPASVVPMLAGPLVQRTVSLAPGLSLRIVDARNEQLRAWVKEGRIDAAVLYGPTPEGVNAARLVEDEIMLVGPHQSPVTAGASIDFRELRDLPLVLPGSDHPLRRILEDEALRAGIKLNVTVEADSHQLMAELVEAGIGFATLPYSAFAREAAQDRLSYIGMRRPVRRELFLALGSESRSPKAAMQVEGFVRQVIGDLIDDRRWVGARLCAIGET